MIAFLRPENLSECQIRYWNNHQDLLMLDIDRIDEFDNYDDIDGVVISKQLASHDSLQKFYNRLFSRKLVPLFWLDLDGTVNISTLSSNAKPTMLFIFPGSIVPLSMGSHQRAFNTLINLNRAGVIVDILIPSGKQDESVRQVLQSFAANVYFYKNKRKKFSFKEKCARFIDQKYRKIQGKSTQLPDLFSERAKYKPTESLKRWVNRLQLAKSYTHIYVNYAWMLNSLAYLDETQNEYVVICDTHDVQYYRNSKVLSRKERLFYNAAFEKKTELAALSKADIVVAISPSDSKLFKKDLPKTRIFEAYPGFDYAVAPIKCRVPGRPVHFGFIGGGMDANVQAIKYIIDNWWPVIQKYSPDSKFFIAGSVCNNPYVLEQAFYHKNIQLLGFVKDINDFYKEVEVCLNPVVVPGGLNFKSVECVVSGKHLFTNALGAKCLGKDFPCQIISDERSIIQVLNSIEFNNIDDKLLRIANQKKALKLFNDADLRRKFKVNFAKDK